MVDKINSIDKIASENDFSDFDELDSIFDGIDLETDLESVENYTGIKYDDIEKVKTTSIVKESDVKPSENDVVKNESVVDETRKEVVVNVDVVKHDKNDTITKVVETKQSDEKPINTDNKIVETRFKKVDKESKVKSSKSKTTRKRERKTKEEMERIRINQEIGRRISEGESIESLVKDKSLKLDDYPLSPQPVNIDMTSVVKDISKLQNENGDLNAELLGEMINKVLRYKGNGMTVVNVKIENFNLFLGNKND